MTDSTTGIRHSSDKGMILLLFNLPEISREYLRDSINKYAMPQGVNSLDNHISDIWYEPGDESAIVKLTSAEATQRVHSTMNGWKAYGKEISVKFCPRKAVECFVKSSTQQIGHENSPQSFQTSVNTSAPRLHDTVRNQPAQQPQKMNSNVVANNNQPSNSDDNNNNVGWGGTPANNASWVTSGNGWGGKPAANNSGWDANDNSGWGDEKAANNNSQNAVKNQSVQQRQTPMNNVAANKRSSNFAVNDDNGCGTKADNNDDNGWTTQENNITVPAAPVHENRNNNNNGTKFERPYNKPGVRFMNNNNKDAGGEQRTGRNTNYNRDNNGGRGQQTTYGGFTNNQRTRGDGYYTSNGKGDSDSSASASGNRFNSGGQQARHSNKIDGYGNGGFLSNENKKRFPGNGNPTSPPLGDANYPPSKVIYLSNIPPDSTREQIHRFLIGNKRLQVVDVANTGNGYSVLVELRSLDEAKHAIEELHETDFMGRKISAHFARMATINMDAHTRREAKRQRNNAGYDTQSVGINHETNTTIRTKTNNTNTKVEKKLEVDKSTAVETTTVEKEESAAVRTSITTASSQSEITVDVTGAQNTEDQENQVVEEKLQVEESTASETSITTDSSKLKVEVDKKSAQEQSQVVEKKLEVDESTSAETTIEVEESTTVETSIPVSSKPEVEVDEAQMQEDTPDQLVEEKLEESTASETSITTDLSKPELKVDATEPEAQKTVDKLQTETEAAPVPKSGHGGKPTSVVSEFESCSSGTDEDGDDADIGVHAQPGQEPPIY